MNLSLYIWLGIMALCLVLSPLLRKKQGKNTLAEQEFVIAGFSLGGAISLFKVLLKVVTDEKLQNDLDWDGTIALCISSGLGMYLSLKEVIKLF
jgi:hypothetical protein